MDRANHYEAAFEAYLQAQRLGYVAVDESRRALLGDRAVKSLDFIVFGANGARLLVDIKGRRFPTGKGGRRRVWECWTTQDDLDGLERWTRLSGPGYEGLFVFAYHLQPGFDVPEDTPDLWMWRGRRYLLRAIAASDYRRHLRVRSPKWGTVTLPRAAFRDYVLPLHHYTRALVTSEPEA